MMEIDESTPVYSFPVCKLILGTFETEAVEMLFDTKRTEFTISYVNSGPGGKCKLSFLIESVVSTDIHFGESNNFVRISLRPKVAETLYDCVPEGHQFRFKSKDKDSRRFIINFRDNLDEEAKGNLERILKEFPRFCQCQDPQVSSENIENVQPQLDITEPRENENKNKKIKIDPAGDANEVNFDLNVYDRKHKVTGRSLRSRNKSKPSYAERDSKDFQSDDIPEHILEESRSLAGKNCITKMPSHPEFERFNDIEELVSYPEGSPTVIKMEDYKCLHFTELISDVVLDFYIQYVLNEKIPKAERDKIHVYNSQFYNFYSTQANFENWNTEENKGLKAADKRYHRVLSYFPDYKELNIFEKDFIVFPCNDNLHWFLAIACFPKLNGSVTEDNEHVETVNACHDQPIRTSCILVFDSVKSNPSRRTKAIIHIRNFITSEYKAKHQNDFAFVSSEIIGHQVLSPQQTNATDCGLFVLEFFEHFFYKKKFTDYRPPVDVQSWFDKSLILNKRQEIAEVIQKLMRDRSPDNTIRELPPIRYCNDELVDKGSIEVISFESVPLENANNQIEPMDCNNGGNNNEEEFNNNNDFNAPDNNMLAGTESSVTEHSNGNHQQRQATQAPTDSARSFTALKTKNERLDQKTRIPMVILSTDEEDDDCMPPKPKVSQPHEKKENPKPDSSSKPTSKTTGVEPPGIMDYEAADSGSENDDFVLSKPKSSQHNNQTAKPEPDSSSKPTLKTTEAEPPQYIDCDAVDSD